MNNAYRLIKYVIGNNCAQDNFKWPDFWPLFSKKIRLTSIDLNSNHM